MKEKYVLLTYKTTILLYCIIFFNFAYSRNIEIVMDYYPPFSYEENNTIKGLSTQVVKSALKTANLKATIKQYPFNRAYRMTRNNKNIFEFSVARTPQRESIFQWIGIVGPSEQVLFSTQENYIIINNLEQLKDYVIGCTFEDVTEQYLSKNQKQYSLKIEKLSSYILNMKKLMKGRIDLWSGNKLVGYHLVQEIGYNKNDIKIAYPINKLTSHFYLVTGLKTSKKLVIKLSQAFETIHKNGTYKKIFANSQI